MYVIFIRGREAGKAEEVGVEGVGTKLPLRVGG
jgi:hypothetical protein